MFRNLIIALAVVLFAACSTIPENEVQLVDRNFSEIVPQQGNFSFAFNQALIADTFLNQWDSTAYVVFQPPIPGRFSWRSEKELVFSPFKELPPATSFEAKLTEEILKHKKGLSLGGELKFKFSTPSLDLLGQHAFWDIRDQNKERSFLHLNLDFNAAISPTDLEKHLKVEIDGKAQSFKLDKQEIGASQTLYFPDVPMSDEDLDLEGTISAVMHPADGTNPMAESLELDFSVASPFKLTINNVKAQHDGSEGEIIIQTSQEVKAQDIKRFISVRPQVAFSVEVDGQMLRLKSTEFSVKQTYDIEIREKLRGVLGGNLKNTFSQQVSFGKLRPSIKFKDNKSVYLSTAGSQMIEAEIINVPEVQVRVVKIYENNILHFLGGGYYMTEYYDYDDYGYNDYYYGGGYQYYQASEKGDVVYEAEINTSTLPLSGNQRLLKLDFEDQLPSHPGLYVVELLARDPYYLSSRTVVCRSDIGLIAKAGKREVSIFANSIKTAQALAGVDIKLIGRNNQEITQLKTDASGYATYTLPEDMAEGFKVNLITASQNGEFAYLPFSRTRIGTSRFEVEGRRENAAGVEAFLYGERDIYRPGETIHLAGIARNYDWAIPDNIPVKLKLLSPDGRAFTSLRKNLDKQGAMEAEISLPVSAQTGRYTAQLWSASDVLLSSMGIMVEEFVPDRIKVDLSLNQEEYDLDEPINVEAKAENFFGPPAAERNYEVEMSLSRRYFYAKDYSSYNFGIPGLNNSFGKERRNGKTNESGLMQEEFKLSPQYANTGLMEADFFMTVFDETGRPVNRRKRTKIFTQDIFLGTKRSRYYNRTGQKVEIPLIAVDKKGKAMKNVEVRVRLIKKEYKTVMARQGSYFRYQSEPHDVILVDKQVTLNGTDYVFDYTPELTGRYELRVSRPGINSYVQTAFYAYGYGRTSYQSFQVNREGRIDIELDKEEYEVGNSAKVLIKTPFEGRLLVTVETDRVLKHYFLDTDKRSAMLDLPLQDAHVPNVYLTATLFKPHKVSDMPLTSAHGFAPIIVNQPKNELPISITAVEKSRSKTKQKIKIKSKPNTTLTVSVVDEGILQLTNFKTPDPYDFFYAKRALQVNSYDVYPFLYPEFSMGSGKPGGDGMDLARRINPLVNDRVKLASFWSGLLKTNSKGEVEYEVDIPEFSGSLRVMVSAFNGKAFAAKAQNITVADPLVISMGLPRFFSPGDTISVPVTLTNTTETASALTAKLQTEGPIKVVGSTSQNARLAASKEQRVYYQIAADYAIGQASVKVEADALGETFSQNINITVRPPSTLQKRSGAGKITVGQKTKVNPDLAEFLPQSVHLKLVVSKNPLVEFTDELERLLISRYGSLDYTVSSAFPQLYYGDFAKMILKNNDRNPNPAYHIQEAIKRLQLMQLRSGGMTYWPQRGYESWWGSIYAAHFLHEAKRAGYSIPEDMLEELQRYMVDKLKNVKVKPYYYNGSSRKEIYPQSVAYSLFVLALTGKPERSTMNYYKSRKNQLNLTSKYLLAAAYAIIGDRKSYKEVIPNSFQGEKADPSFGDEFISHVRDEALALYVLQIVSPDDPQIGTMAKHVSENLRNRPWMNTQERAFSFLSLGKIAEEAARTQAKATVLFDGKIVGTFTDKPVELTTDQPAQGSYEIITEGTGTLYYFWETEGISVDGSYVEEDNYMKVRKTFYNRDGGIVNPENLVQNDLVVVKLTIEGLSQARVENIAIADILPAGLEIENPRITTLPNIDWMKNRCREKYLDIRDDRIIFFTDLYGTGSCSFYYLARAVTPGTFKMGPASADALYRGEYHSYNGGGLVKIRPKQ